MDRYGIYEKLGIDKDVYMKGEETVSSLNERFEAIDELAEINQLKVIGAMRKAGVSEACLTGTTGYGYNDLGREAIEKVYAETFRTEAALVRPLIACGTHALSITLFGMLRPGDELLYISGRPYDTLEEVIGIRKSEGSLAEYGITYNEVPLLGDGSFDLEAIKKAVRPETKLVAIQRSRGYSERKSFSVAEIGEAIRVVKEIDPDIPVMVDNCYGEFVEEREPSEVGADLIVGSLIKNPGGGLAPSGGYICGTKKCIDRVAARMTCPGLGAEVGPTLGTNRAFLQGFFLAPVVTAAAEKGAIFAAELFGSLGFKVFPEGKEERHDIIQAVTLGSEKALLAFCRGIQKGSPVDAHVTPEPWAMPGYDHPVVMAAGTFISGSSIELSADAPLCPPYRVYFQGGLTFPSAKLGILSALQCMKENGTAVI